MKTYTTIEHNKLKWHYRISGNRYGWNMYVANDLMFHSSLRYTGGKQVKYPFWTQPAEKSERKSFYEKQAKMIIDKYL